MEQKDIYREWSKSEWYMKCENFPILFLNELKNMKNVIKQITSVKIRKAWKMSDNLGKN